MEHLGERFIQPAVRMDCAENAGAIERHLHLLVNRLVIYELQAARLAAADSDVNGISSSDRVRIGRSGLNRAKLMAVATRHGLSPHGIALAVRDRVARVYFSGEELVSIRTRLGTEGPPPS